MALYFLIGDASDNLSWNTDPVVAGSSNLIINISADTISWNFSAAKPPLHEQLAIESTTDVVEWS